jgi:hypothetical protein
MSCPPTDELLALLDDQPGPRDHLDDCPDCAATLADLARIRLVGRRQALAGAWLGDDPIVASAVRRTLRRRRLRRVQQAVSVAAGLLLVAVLGVEPVLRVRVELPSGNSAAAPVASALWGEQLAYLR